MVPMEPTATGSGTDLHHERSEDRSQARLEGGLVIGFHGRDGLQLLLDLRMAKGAEAFLALCQVMRRACIVEHGRADDEGFELLIPADQFLTGESQSLEQLDQVQLDRTAGAVLARRFSEDRAKAGVAASAMAAYTKSSRV